MDRDGSASVLVRELAIRTGKETQDARGGEANPPQSGSGNDGGTGPPLGRSLIRN